MTTTQADEVNVYMLKTENAQSFLQNLAFRDISSIQFIKGLFSQVLDQEKKDIKSLY